jgi:hypothetical protein
VVAATIGTLAVRALPAAFGEDDGTPTDLAPEPSAVAAVSGAKAGTWAQWDVTSAVHGDGDVGFRISGAALDPASFSSREGSDAPQLVVTPDDDRGLRLAGLLDPQKADAFVAAARDDDNDSLDALDVIAAPAGEDVPGRYIGVHHTLVGGTYVTKLATSDDLTTWTHQADLDTHASQPTLAALPDGGFLLATERDVPDAQYVSRSNIVVRHYASWDALAAGAFDRQADLPRTLAQTAEGTPGLSVTSWNGPDDSKIAITFHYLKNISVDRQAAGVLTNFDPASWAPQPDAPLNSLLVGLGTRGNLGDRADLLFEGHPFAVVEAQSVKADFSTWRWYLYDRERNEARLLALHAPAGSYALGNPTVRTLTGPDGRPLVFFSGYVFSQGAAQGEAGQFIALRHAATDPGFGAPPPSPVAPAPPVTPPAVVPVSVPLVPSLRLQAPAPLLDTTPPRATLTASAQRLGATVVVRIGCPDEICRATTTGTVRIPHHQRTAATTYRLKAVKKTIGPGATVTVRLTLPVSTRAAIRRALRSGKPIAVKLHAGVADHAGNMRMLARQVRLRLA